MHLSLALKAGLDLNQPQQFRKFVDYVNGDIESDVRCKSSIRIMLFQEIPRATLDLLGWDNETEPMAAKNGTTNVKYPLLPFPELGR